MEVLLLEDDRTIGEGLEYALTAEGYGVALCNKVSSAISEIENKNFDLYILDLTLPDGSGYEVCRRIREKTNAPVIFLTAFDDEINVVRGLEMGADDYITKPFRLRELLARIKAVRKRAGGESTSVIRLGAVTVNLKEGKVYKDGAQVFLTALEYRLFLTLVNNRGQVLTRSQLLESIWDVAGDFVNDNTLSVYIKRIRDKLEDNPNDPKLIKTVRGRGYSV